VEGLDLLVSPCRHAYSGWHALQASVTFGVTPDSLMDAWMRQLNRTESDRIGIYDVLYNIDKNSSAARLPRNSDRRWRYDFIFLVPGPYG